MDLDDVVPMPEHVTSQSRLVAAPPEVVWEELRTVALSSLPLSALLIGVRFLPALLRRPARRLPLDRSFVDVLPIPLLSVEPPTALVHGGLLQPWRMTGGERAPELDATEVLAFDEPGWVKVAMEFRLAPADGNGTLLRTETRVAATDPTSALLFSAYWLVVRPGSSTIRREVLATVAHRAEARTAVVS
jgi:hypothetical protein